MPDLTTFELETERLKMVASSEKYLNDVFNEFTEEVSKYLLFRTTGNLQDTRDHFIKCQVDHKNGESLHTVVVDKITGEFLGKISIRELKTRTPNVGLWFKSGAQRKGYAFEACKALIEWTQQEYNPEYIIYDVFVDNEASNGLAQKLGGKLTEQTTVKNSRGEEFVENIYHIF